MLLAAATSKIVKSARPPFWPLFCRGFGTLFGAVFFPLCFRFGLRFGTVFASVLGPQNGGQNGGLADLTILLVAAARSNISAL